MTDRPAAEPVARPGASGFTLIELVVTIAVAVILLSLAAPSFVSFQRNSQLTATANTFLAAAAAARSEAMKRQLFAFVRPTDNISWTNGWTSYVDTDWDTLNTAADIQIGVQTRISSTISVPAGADTSKADGTSHYLAFNGAGYLWDVGNAAPVGQAAITFTNTTDSRLVILNASGRMRVCNPSNDTTCTTNNAF